MINWRLASEPVNWLVVWSFLIIGLAFVDIFRDFHSQTKE